MAKSKPIHPRYVPQGALEAKGQLEAAQHAQLVSTLLGTLLDSPTPSQSTQAQLAEALVDSLTV